MEVDSMADFNNAPTTTQQNRYDLSPEMKQFIVASAYASLDFSQIEPNQASLDEHLMRRVNSLRYQLRDTSLPMRMLSCVPLYATIISVEFEESSTRYVITFKTDSEDAETETVRSDRTDGRDGDFVKKLWSNPHLIGAPVIIYKTNEDMSTKNPRDRGRTVRVAPYVTRRAI